MMSKEPIKTWPIIAQKLSPFWRKEWGVTTVFMASRTPTKVYGPISFNSLCRFFFKIRAQFQRQECKGVQLSNLLSEYGIFLQDDLSLSSRSCPKCARRILTSCKALQGVNQPAQAAPSPGNPSVKRLAKNSPSTGPCVSVDGSNSNRVHSQGREREKSYRLVKRTCQPIKVYHK